MALHLRTHRVESGLTQQELSEESGVQIRLVSLLEQGRLKPTRAEKEALADTLEIDTNDVIWFDCEDLEEGEESSEEE